MKTNIHTHSHLKKKGKGRRMPRSPKKSKGPRKTQKRSKRRCKYATKANGKCMSKKEYDSIKDRKNIGETPYLPLEIWGHIADIREEDEMRKIEAYLNDYDLDDEEGGIELRNRMYFVSRVPSRTFRSFSSLKDFVLNHKGEDGKEMRRFLASKARGA